MKKLILLVFLASSFVATKAQVSAENLRCNLMANPLALSSNTPRFSWQVVAKGRGIIQEAYEISVSSDSLKLADGQGDLWSSGKVNSDAASNITYAGKPLKTKSKYYWKVRVWTNKGGSAWSRTASFGTGLLNYKDWEGRWIGFDRYFPWDNEDQNRLSARYFRKEFAVNKEVKSATAYIIGLGLYELTINGKKIGDQVLAPAPTDYTQNVKYNAFDVTPVIKQGKHAIGVILGNGRFFAMRQAKPYKVKTFGLPKMLMQINIQYKDGTSATIKTDESWKGTAEGPILANNEYDGEEYDARKEFAGWDKPGFDEKKWLTAEYVQEPGGTYEPQENEFMKVMQSIAPVSIKKRSNGNYIIDFGQNMAGWVKLQVKGEKGQKLTLKFAESLKEDRSLFIENLRDAKTTDTYILKGEGTEVWEPRFTFHGFRYVEVSGYPGTPTQKDFTARFVYDDMATVGKFESSNTLLNQIHRNSWWGIASNYKGMPIDCPQRNERQPWLGDRSTVSYGESFLFNNTALYNKWADDIRYSQKADGAIPDVAPAFWRYYSDNMTWPSTLHLVVDMLYRQTGDKEVIRNNYPAMKKWLQYMESRYLDAEGVMTKDSYGDWCVPPVSAEAGRGVNADQKHPSALIATAYDYYVNNLMIRFAKLAGQDQDIAGFAAMAARSKEAFNKRFYHKEGFYGENTLTDNILPVAFGIVEEENRNRLVAQIASIINKNNGHLSTGLIGVQWLMRTLSEIGRADLAYTIASKKTYPSWGYMIENGSTAIWELWNGNTANPKMNSQNHVMMLGDLLIWYYENLAGIKSDLEEAGYKKIIMRPEMINDLSYVKASYNSVRGEIRSDWKKSGKTFTWNITVPANSKAIVYIPAGGANKVKEGNKKVSTVDGVKLLRTEASRVVLEVGSGNYSFNSEM
ncbi:glycoside hydrolase family 78 protein [Desertivirga brevis]|uniref:glycoside hydrolase family 78 protein n=1 Tax=Desertivirga brevis TaxID=2810310 RepID=UPI001A968070|nr:glycoside hydrolase family 78 protein [Pedobacter sp. SYSU D00873]